MAGRYFLYRCFSFLCITILGGRRTENARPEFGASVHLERAAQKLPFFGGFYDDIETYVRLSSL